MSVVLSRAAIARRMETVLDDRCRDVFRPERMAQWYVPMIEAIDAFDRLDRNDRGLFAGAKADLLSGLYPNIAPRPLIKRGDMVFTVGSCFARNVEERLETAEMIVPALKVNVPKSERRAYRPNGILTKDVPPVILSDSEWARKYNSSRERLILDDLQ